MDPETLLNQIDKPERPQWMTVIEDWFPVKVPRPIYIKWIGRLSDRDHLHVGYYPATETMVIKCMLLKIHQRVPTCFIQQATLMVNQLSPAAINEVRFGTTESACFLACQLKLIA